VQSWTEASAYILATGQEVMPMGGFSGSVPEPTLTRVRQLVATGQLRLAWPEGLMELRPGALRPGAPDETGIRIMFAVEPPGTALLIAVLEGSEAIQDHYPEAILLSADMLRRVRAGRAPEAAAHRYHDPQSLLEEFASGTSPTPASPRGNQADRHAREG
jgi:hypothetical protein